VFTDLNKIFLRDGLFLGEVLKAIILISIISQLDRSNLAKACIKENNLIKAMLKKI
tara:strand:+ start:480 stop:647 length:168 start_codon:yes stop_codon:yes gene_type:complete